MRLTAYKKAINESKALPGKISELSSYFRSNYNPSLTATHYILDMARRDDKLYNGEYCELYDFAFKQLDKAKK